MDKKKMKRLLLLNIPYLIVGLFATNLGEAWRMAEGAEFSEKLLGFFATFPVAISNPLPSFHPSDLLVGIVCGAVMRLAVYLKGKNAKKFRHNVEYGSARWGTAKDIEPFMAPKFEDNIILTKTERLMMSNRPKNPANARNKNVLIVGGSGSGKTRFWLKPNLLQMHSSYVVTDPKGSIVVECGNALLKNGYNIKIFNTINFRKSMHYNPFAYIHSEKDILKLVTTLIANTKGDGKAGDEFWTKAETLLYCALIGYIHYEAPVEEQNFSTLIEFLNAMEVREDDEEFQNPVDLMFEALEKKKPNHFAVRQYKKYKLAAGVVCSKRLLNQAVEKSLRTHNLKPKKGAQVMRKNEKITALYERLSRDDFGKDDDQQRESNSISNQKAIPNIVIRKTNPLGHYGRLRKAYLEMHRPILFNELVLSDKLFEHCAEIDEAARNRMELIVLELAKRNGVTEQLKAENQMEWVRQMNACKAQAEEIVKAELIYD